MILGAAKASTLFTKNMLPPEKILALGEAVLNFWLAVVLLVFGIPLLFAFVYRKKSFALPVAFAAVCTGICVLLIYLIFAAK